MDKRINEIIKSIPPDKIILNIGCAQNQQIHQALIKKSKKVVGIDIDKKGIEVMRKLNFKVYDMNAEYITLKQKFDYIIAGELIEHLSNPGLFLNSIKNNLSKNGQIILTTPNLSIPIYTLVLLFDKTQDPTHVYYFDTKNLKSLVSRYDLKIKYVKYIAPEIKFLGNNFLFKIIFFVSTILANLGYLFINKRLFGSYLFIILQRNSES